MLGGTNATAFPRQESGGIPSNVGLVWRHRGPGLATSKFLSKYRVHTSWLETVQDFFVGADNQTTYASSGYKPFFAV